MENQTMVRFRIGRRRLLALVSGGAIGVLAACSTPAPASPTVAPAAPTSPPAPAATTKPAASTATSTPATQAAVPPTQAPAPATQAPAAPTGPKGTVTLVHPTIPQTLDPNIGVVEVTQAVTSHMYDFVVDLTPDGKLQPMLAESWRPLDATTWEFKLRKDVKFHDGTPFNAEVLKFTIERIFDPTYNSLQKTFWVNVVSVTTPDDFTCVIKTERPMGTMPYAMALTNPVPPSVGKDPAAFPQTPIGTGPFKFVQWIKDDRVIFEANTDYWGDKPRVQQVVFRSIPELSTKMSALEAGEVDVVLEIVPEDIQRLQGKSDIQIQSVQTYRTSWLWMNGQRAPFTDVRVRQAIQHAVNLDDIDKSIITGVGYKARAPISPKVFGFNPNLPPYEYNPAMAKSLLKDAGFPNGFETTATGVAATGGYTRFGDVAQAILAQLGDVGIRAKVVAEDPATANKNLLELNWDLTFQGSTATTGDADNGMGRLYLSSAKRTGWSNDEVDRLLLIGRESTNQDERLKAYQDAQVILWREGPTVWTYHAIDTIGVRSRVHGFVGRPDRRLNARGLSVDA